MHFFLTWMDGRWSKDARITFPPEIDPLWHICMAFLSIFPMNSSECAGMEIVSLFFKDRPVAGSQLSLLNPEPIATETFCPEFQETFKTS